MLSFGLAKGLQKLAEGKEVDQEAHRKEQALKRQAENEKKYLQEKKELDIALGTKEREEVEKAREALRNLRPRDGKNSQNELDNYNLDAFPGQLRNLAEEIKNLYSELEKTNVSDASYKLNKELVTKESELTDAINRYFTAENFDTRKADQLKKEKAIYEETVKDIKNPNQDSNSISQLSNKIEPHFGFPVKLKPLVDKFNVATIELNINNNDKRLRKRNEAFQSLDNEASEYFKEINKLESNQLKKEKALYDKAVENIRTFVENPKAISENVVGFTGKPPFELESYFAEFQKATNNLNRDNTPKNVRIPAYKEAFQKLEEKAKEYFKETE